MKRLLQLRTEDWIKVITGIKEDVTYTEMKSDKNPTVESRLDNLYQVGTGKNRFILNIEPQGYADPALSARMLRYRADIYESFMSTGQQVLPIRQTVIYFSEINEITDNKIVDETFNQSRLDYSYDVMRVWEMDKKIVLDNKLYGLYPLLPLMKDDRKKHNKEEVFKEAVQIALAIEDKALSADILAAMSFLAEVEYSKSLITKYIRREMLMQSELWKEWIEEERLESMEKGKREGEIESMRKSIKLTLLNRFNITKINIDKILDQIEDRVLLENLFNRAFQVQSVDEFNDILDNIIK